MMRCAWVALVFGGCLVEEEPCVAPWQPGDRFPAAWESRAGLDPSRCDCDPAGVPFGGGDGSADAPYQHCAPDHLDNVRELPAAHHVLCSDIDLEDVAFAPIPELSGELHGNGFAIRGWRHVDREARGVAFVQSLSGHLHDLQFLDYWIETAGSSAGLVDVTVPGSGARLDDLVVTGTNLGTDGHLAGVVQDLGEGTSIRQVLWSGDIDNRGHGFVGAVVDRCAGTCSRLLAYGTMVNDDWKSGGVVQSLPETGVLEESIGRVTLDVQNRSGGLVSILSGGTVRDSYFEGCLTDTYRLGGIAGETYRSRGLIQHSYAAGRVDGDHDLGGLVGYDGTGVTVEGALWDCDATGLGRRDGPGRALTDAEMRDPEHPAFDDWERPWVHDAGDRPRLAWERR